MGAALVLHPAHAPGPARASSRARGRGTRSTPSSSRASRPRAWRPPPRPRARELLRRLSFDLTGLPPTPEEVRAFDEDRAAGAYERQVDRLLASPALRRAHGRLLARPRALRRQRGLPQRQLAADVALPRLGGAGVQPQPALRPLHRRAARGRPAAGRRRSSRRSPPATTGCCRPPRRAARSRRSTARSTWPTGAQRLHGLAGRRPSAARSATTTSSTRTWPRTSTSFGAFFADVKETAVGRRSPDYLPDAAQRRAARRGRRRDRAPSRGARGRDARAGAAQAAWEKAVRRGGPRRFTTLEPVESTTANGTRVHDPGQRLLDHRLHVPRTEAALATPTPSATRPSSRASPPSASRR